jgi:CheY-like chemotaxis protein
MRLDTYSDPPDPPRILILDWMMPRRDVLQNCRKLRADKPVPYTYILMVSTAAPYASAIAGAGSDLVEAMDAGVDDYLTTPFNIQELKVRLRHGVQMVGLVAGHTTAPARPASRIYQSSFLSYSSKDSDFASDLLAGLSTEGVSCWFAAEDLKIGDPFRQRIDEAVHRHDKLLLILSETPCKARGSSMK